MNTRRKHNPIKTIYIAEENESANRGKAWLVLAACLLAGLQLMYRVVFPIPLKLLVSVFLCTFFLAICSVIVSSKFQKKRVWLWGGYLAVIVGVMVYIQPMVLLQCALNYMNRLITDWNVLHDDGVGLFQASAVSTSQMATLFFLASVIILFVLCLESIHNRRLLLTIILLVVIVSGLLVGKVSWCGMSFLLSAIWGMLVFRQEKGYSGKGLAYLIGLSVVLCVASYYIVPASPISGTRAVREMAAQKLEDIRYGKDELPEGDLYRGDTLLDSKEDKLIISTSQIKNYYFKGFVGGEYENGKWIPLKNSAYGNRRSGMLQWLSDKGFWTNEIYGQYYLLNRDHEKEKNSITVKNVGADREYIYTPFAMNQLNCEGSKAQKDNGFHSHKIRGSYSYELEETSSDMPGELLSAENWLYNPITKNQSDFINQEKVYRSFVYDEYTDLSDGMLQLMKHYFYQDATKDDKTGIYATTAYIRKVLKKTAVYADHPEPVPDSKDPIEWFLSEGKQGNAVLFAATAVEAFRCFGIPARYAEGYLLPKSRFYVGDKNEITLTGQNAHAWVQVYMDGMGWVDIDVTPGFYYEEYDLMKMVENPQGTQLTPELADDETKDRSGNQVGGGDKKENSKEHNLSPYLVGAYVLAGVFLLAVLWIVLLEIRRFGEYIWWKRKYQKAEDAQKCQMLHRNIRKLCALLGVEATLGWHTNEISEQLEQMVADVYHGEYALVERILEKGIYGDIPLKRWELRVVHDFREKLLFSKKKKMGMIRRLCFRYQIAYDRKIIPFFGGGVHNFNKIHKKFIHSKGTK